MTAATVTFEDGSTQSLSEADLAVYGITLLQSASTPQLMVYSADASFSDMTFDLTISSTGVEETTWADYTSVTINYINPSIPSASTIEAFSTSHEAGTAYTVTM